MILIVMSSEALQRNPKDEARLSNISDYSGFPGWKNQSEILRFARNENAILAQCRLKY
jgi:hypothetical protein